MKSNQIQKAKGIILAYIKGCLLPNLDLNLSDQTPTNGSDIASKKSEIPMAIEARYGSNPKTWL